MRIHRTILLTASAATICALALAGCASADQAGGATKPLAAAPVAAGSTASSLLTPAPYTPCKDGQSPVASLAPGRITTDPSTVTNSPTMTNIRKNHHLTVGTSGDVLLWGATDPHTGDLTGFDIELLAEVAKYAGVDPAKTSYHVIDYGDRLPDLQNKTVDVVAHTMTINCDRWQGTNGQPNAINFSTEYYEAGQRVLVRADSHATTILGLAGKTVCVPSASTNLIKLDQINKSLNPPIKVVALDAVGDCLVKFQEGEVDAITGDDTVLAGFVAQDPYAKLAGKAFTKEPYGLGINQNDPQFTQFVNAVLEKLRSNGRLAQIYRDTMGKATPGSALTIPPAVYGRNIGELGRKTS